LAIPPGLRAFRSIWRAVCIPKEMRDNYLFAARFLDFEPKAARRLASALRRWFPSA